jgi:hypothetical protein
LSRVPAPRHPLPDRVDSTAAGRRGMPSLLRVGSWPGWGRGRTRLACCVPVTVPAAGCVGGISGPACRMRWVLVWCA